jgi:hypothetical protein
MRRTFQDLCRAAEVKDLVTRSISGHVTEAMQRHNSTVAPQEQRAGVVIVISLFAPARHAMPPLPTLVVCMVVYRTRKPPQKRKRPARGANSNRP